jgi:hypothetical protein
MPTEEDIADYLKGELAADAAILVGSRADGVARHDSDWDIYVLVDDRSGPRGPRPEPRLLQGARLDVGVVHLPIGPEDVLTTFGPNLQQARILFDTTGGAAHRIIEWATSTYAKGRHLSKGEKGVKAHQVARSIATMISRQDQPGPFFEAASFVFYVSHRYWYEVIHHRYSQSVHRAMVEIQERDPEFHTNLIVLASPESVDAKITAAQYLYERLFGETQLN